MKLGLPTRTNARARTSPIRRTPAGTTRTERAIAQRAEDA